MSWHPLSRSARKRALIDGGQEARVAVALVERVAGDQGRDSHHRPPTYDRAARRCLHQLVGGKHEERGHAADANCKTTRPRFVVATRGDITYIPFEGFSCHSQNTTPVFSLRNAASLTGRQVTYAAAM